MLSSLSLFVVVVANVWVFASAQQACTPVDSNIDPKDLPKISTQFQTRIEIFSNENKDVLETLVKFDADNNIAQVVYRQNNGTFSESYFYLQNEVFIRFNTACQIGKLNESFGSFFFGAAQDQFGNYHIKSPNDFLFWNNGVPHKKLDQVTYRGITADHYQSCQWFNVPGVTNTTFLVDYYFKTPDYKSPIELTGFEAYSQIPLGFTARGIEQATSKPFNREYYFYEYKNFLEFRQDITNEREGEYCVGQTYKLPVPIIPNHFSFVYQEIGINIVDTGRFFYSSDWKVTREDITDPFFSVKDPVKIIHDFYSGVDYVINKIRNTCTQDNLGSNKNAKFNAAKLDMRHYMVMKTPNDLFEIDDSYFFAGNRYERGIKSDVYVTKRVINPLLNASLPSNQIVAEAIFGKIQESDYIGVDDYEPVFPVSVHLYQPSLPEPIILNTFDFDSVLKRSSFDISNCFSEKDIIRYALRFNYPEGLSQHRFDREFGRRLEEAFDLEVMKIISVYNASPLRILAAKFEAFERYFTIESGFTDHAEPIYQFAKSQKKKIKNAGETIVADSAESCARACVYKTMYANSPDPKCLSFDFYTSPSGARCTLFSFTRYTNPNIEYDDEIIDTYSKIVETFDSVDEKPLYALIQESVARREFVIKAKNTTGTEFTFMADELFEIILDQNGNTGGFTSFFEEFSLFGKDTDFDVDEVKKRPALMLRERTGITIDECSRQCLREAAFVCELMTYGKANRECKWTSLPNIYNVQDDDTKDLFREVPTFDLFERDPFYNYRKYPYMVSSVVGLTSIEVKDARECALKCNTDKSINCRSFNFCQGVSKKFYCIRSELNVFSSERDPLIVDSSLCDHYSKLAIGDFKVEIGIGLGVKPESTVTRDSVEGCAELCSFEDKYLCRSFDYVIDTSTCRFYRENIVDKALTDLKLTEDTGINHYSRLYYVKDGVLKSVEPMKIKESSSYGAGTVIGILIVVIIGGFLFGIMSTFVYMKVSRKTNFLPVMKFSNPNYHQQTNE